MLIGYLDDSYAHPIVNMTMAGYISTLNDWKRFEKRSKKLFDNFGLDQPFEAKHFANTKRQFAGWDLARRLDFVDQWLDTARGTVRLGISSSIPVALYDTSRRKLGRNHRISGLGQCLNEVLVELGKHEIAPQIEAEGLSLILEEGNKNNAGAVEWFYEQRKVGAIPDHFRSRTIAPKTKCRAIQCADYLAYYSAPLCRRRREDQR